MLKSICFVLQILLNFFSFQVLRQVILQEFTIFKGTGFNIYRSLSINKFKNLQLEIFKFILRESTKRQFLEI